MTIVNVVRSLKVGAIQLWLAVRTDAVHFSYGVARYDEDPPD